MELFTLFTVLSVVVGVNSIALVALGYLFLSFEDSRTRQLNDVWFNINRNRCEINRFMDGLATANKRIDGVLWRSRRLSKTRGPRSQESSGAGHSC